MRKSVAVTQWYPLLLLQVVLQCYLPIYASRATIDADGSADYTSIYTLIADLNNSTISPDTVLFTGADQDSYTITLDISRTDLGTIMIRSDQTNPDLFPLITQTATHWVLLANNNVYFENLIFSASATIPNAQSIGLTLSFRNCVFRDNTTSYCVKMEGGVSNTTLLTNCLFEGNTNVFDLLYWGGSPTITIFNCTFDNNDTIWVDDPTYTTNISLKNCIFSNNTIMFQGNNLRGVTTNSLTSESTSGYGSGCVSNSNPSYVGSSRSIPSDWMIQSGSPAENIGTSTGAPTSDISGYSRSSPDAGCWEYQPDPDTYTWDNSTGAGYTAHSNTWSTSDAYWSMAGTLLVAWPGPGYGARFAGSDGNWTVTVSGTQYVDSIAFGNEGYVISGGTSLIVAKKLSGPVFGSSPPYAAGSDSSKAFDGSVSTFFDDAASDTGNAGFDLGSGNAQRISYIRFYPRSTYEGRMDGGKFQGSNDGSSWTDLYTISGTPSSGWTSVSVSSATAWRYLRYLGPAGGYCNVAEVEFYGMGRIYVGNSIDDTIATVLAGNSGIRTDGGNTGSDLVLTGTNTYAGPTEIYGGRLNILTLADGGSNSSIGSSGNSASNLLLNGGAFRYIGGTTTCDRLFTVGTDGGAVYASGSGTLTLDNTGSIAFAGSGTRTLELGGAYAGTNVFAPVLGDGSGGATSLNKTSTTCTWVLTGSNTYTGTTTISEGGLQIGNGGTTGAISNSSTIANSGTLTFDRSDSYTYSGTISGSGDLTQNGSGTLILGGTNTYTGVTSISDGTLQVSIVGNGGVSGNIGAAASDAANLVIDGGTLVYNSASHVDCDHLFTIGTGGATLTDASTGTIDFVNTGSLAYTGSGARTLTLAGTAPATFQHELRAVIGDGTGGATSVVKNGTSRWSLYGTNTFTGTVTVNGGILKTANTAALGNSANTITVNNGGCIDVNGYNLQAYTNDITINGQVSSDSGALVNFGSGQFYAIRKIALGSNASIGNNGGGRFDIGREIGGTCITGNSYTLTKVGNNGVALLAEGTGLAGVVVNGGTLRVENTNAVGTAAITVNSGGELDSWWGLTFAMNLVLNGGTLGSVEDNAYNTTWSGAVSVTAASTLACKADNTNTLSGAITGSGSLTVTGTEGVYILSGNSNTYSGGTTVSGATLRITNTSGSATGTGAVSVADGATLDGTGSISSTLGMSGTLSPGTGGAGTLTIGNSVTFTGSGVFSAEANGTAAGSGYDQLAVSSGTVTLGSAQLSFSLGYTPAINDAFTIIDNQGASAVSGTFSGIAQGDTITASYAGTPYDCRVSYTGGTGNDVVITVVRVSAEDYANEWGYSQSILLNTTASGANVTGNVMNFPVLLRLNPGNFDGFANIQPNGVDIRFAKIDGTKLKYEIERWKDYDNDADTAEIWVKLDTVYGNNKTQSFKMYWGKPEAADSSDAAAVFDTASGFVGVWHLGEDGNTTADGYANASGSNHGTGYNMTASSDVGAVIGMGSSFDAGSSQYISTADSPFDLTDSFTITTWIYTSDATGDWARVIDKIERWSSGYALGAKNGTYGFAGFWSSSGWGGDPAATLEPLSDATWQHVSVTISNGVAVTYRNGNTVATFSSNSGQDITTNNYNLCFGKSANQASYWTGSLDEIRIEKTPRSGDWIKLCYENQKTGQTLVQYEDYTTWGFSRNITINTSGVTSTNCIGFPLLVRLTSTNFDFNQVQDSGQDIRFAKSNGARLVFQIERWNKAGALAELWVRVDTVYGNNSSQYITMYWGKGGVSSKSSGSAVFDTSNGFRGVWHLNTSGTGPRPDATYMNNSAATKGAAYSTSGAIAGCDVLVSASSQYDSVASGGINLSNKNFTVMAWAKMDNAAPSTFYGILGQGTNATDQGLHFGYRNSTSKYSFAFFSDDLDQLNTYSGGTSWHLVAATFNTSDKAQILYMDGVQDTSRTASGNYTGTGVFRIGNTYDGTTDYFGGSLDEVVVADSVRSADWIKLCYETQKPTPTILTSDSADAFRPLTIRREMSGSTTDSIIIATKRWAIRFARSAGGGIDFLAADTNSTNQLDANLFYFVYNSAASYSGTGTLTLLDSSTVFARVRQAVTVSSQPFIVDYTILGSGRLYTRVYTAASSALSGGLAFRIANNATASYTNIAFGSSAATSRGVAHLDAGSGKYDLIMAPYDLWSDADAIQTNSKYTGLASSGWSTPANTYPSWEFMVDFAHRTLTDSATAYRYVADYRGSDTLGFYAGTPFLNQAWEYSEKGEWGFDEGTGTTIADNTGHGHTATASSTPTWSSGIWNSSAVTLGGSDSIIVAHDDAFSVSRIHTISAWIKPDALLSSSVAIFKKYSSSGVGYAFTGGPAGALQYHVANGGTPAALQSTTVLTPGEWYHVAAKLFIQGSDDYLALYVNGKLDTLTRLELDSYFGTNSSDVAIGKEFNGVIDDVRFYTIALSEEEIRAMYLRGYAPERGMYRLRADNDNTLYCRMHGNVNKRFLPVLQITNYWASTLPTYVYVDGVGLTSGTDYHAALDDNRNQLTIGFNRVITGNSAIFIDDNMANGYKRTGETQKMYWGIAGSSDEFFWVKNTGGSYFGSNTSNEWYINWQMNTASIKDGEISWMRSSVTNPYTKIDTVHGTNLIQGTDGYNSAFGHYSIDYTGASVSTTDGVTNSFTYTVEESTLVRVRLRVNERTVVSGSDSYNIVTRWTLYPFGQIFRYDSIYAQSAAPAIVWHGVFWNDSATSTVYADKYELRGGVLYEFNYPDMVAAWLSMKNTSGYQQFPFDADSMASAKNEQRVGVDFNQSTGSPAKWDDVSVESSVFYNVHTGVNETVMYRIANGVQYTQFSGRRALSMVTGTLDSTTAGDLDEDGFAEQEGAYIVGASNNTVSFILPAHGDTCRYYPAFRITGYTAVTTPQYVFLYHGQAAGDTVALLDGYQYNAYVNHSSNELLIQIDSSFCDSVGIYISYDKTLAVKMSNFEARPGNRRDTIIWRTESEQENLGYRIERRIQPGFFDSVYVAYADVDPEDPLGNDPDNVFRLIKRRLISSEDTGWATINRELIPGAPSGVSHGPRDYQYIDRKLFNGICYEYKLIAIDYNSGEEEHGPVAVIPQKLVPARFMLGPNYPNPFRYTTRIWFALPVETPVSLNIYTLQGRLVRRLITPDRKLSADDHQVFWDGSGDNGMRCAAGPYIYRLITGRFVKARVMLMVR